MPWGSFRTECEKCDARHLAVASLAHLNAIGNHNRMSLQTAKGNAIRVREYRDTQSALPPSVLKPPTCHQHQWKATVWSSATVSRLQSSSYNTYTATGEGNRGSPPNAPNDLKICGNVAGNYSSPVQVFKWRYHQRGPPKWAYNGWQAHSPL